MTDTLTATFIPAETPILIAPSRRSPPLRGGRYDCFLSRKRERIEVRAAGIQLVINLRAADKAVFAVLSHCVGAFSIIWIPAFAGMTK